MRAGLKKENEWDYTVCLDRSLKYRVPWGYPTMY